MLRGTDRQGTNAEQRSRSAFASTLSLVLAIVAIASGLAQLLVDGIRGSDECGTRVTLVLDVLIWTTLVSSILAVIVGILALAIRSDRLGSAVAGIVVGVVMGALVLTATLFGTYVCSSGAA